jgi:hypothetical protein
MDAQMSYGFDYASTHFNGRTLAENVMGALEGRTKIKEAYYELFGDKGILGNIYFGSKDIDEKTYADHSKAIADGISKIVKAMTSNPAEQIALKSKLAVISVEALKPGANTIWDSQRDPGQDSDRVHKTANGEMRYKMLYAICIILAVPLDEFVPNKAQPKEWTAEQKRGAAHADTIDGANLPFGLGGWITDARREELGIAGAGLDWKQGYNLTTVMQEIGIDAAWEKQKQEWEQAGVDLATGIHSLFGGGKDGKS